MAQYSKDQKSGALLPKQTPRLKQEGTLMARWTVDKEHLPAKHRITTTKKKPNSIKATQMNTCDTSDDDPMIDKQITPSIYTSH